MAHLEQKRLSEARNQGNTATKERVRVERFLNYQFKAGIPDVGDPKRTGGLTPEEYLAASEKRHSRAAEAWFKWRDSAPLAEVWSARQAEGPGAQLCAEFRATRAWAQEAANQLQVHRQHTQRLENAQCR